MDKITIRAFGASAHPELCETYIKEHKRVLSDIGVISSLPVDTKWTEESGTVVICAFHDELGMVAGVRLQRPELSEPFPMETYVHSLDVQVHDIVSRIGRTSTAEMCGLWNAHRFSGRGVPILLLKAAVSVVNQLSLKSMICLAAEYMAPYCKDLGFTVIEEIGDFGRLQFPIPTINSYPMVLSDSNILSQVLNHKRERILSLRIAPTQIRTECPKTDTMEVHYNLLLSNEVEEYLEIARYRQGFAA